MSLLVDRRRSKLRTRAEMARRTTPDGETAVINVGLINNMPDAALQATERQFFSLLEAAAGSILVRLRLYSLPDVPRTEFGHQHVADRYWSIDDLWDSDLDGLIVTGREPQAADLREEPYWKTLTQVIDWAEDHTISSIWSCLVAHAALLHIDGIDRNPLGEKRFGLYECAKILDHPIMDGIPGSVPLPHSRWNDIQESNLTARGYDVLARSVSGPDIFAKKRKSLFLFFQCHPEYDAHALMLEYRRDIGRFLRGQRDTYPPIPQGYFADDAVEALEKFRAQALAQPHEDLLMNFPTVIAAEKLTNSWRTPATRLYTNWLSYIAAQKAQKTSDHLLATTVPSQEERPR